MSAGFRLVPLACRACGGPMTGEAEDAIFYCTACHNGYRYEPSSGGLVPVEVSFVASPTEPAEGHLPFWLVPARVEIRQRDATGGALAGLLGFFLGDQGERGGPGEGAFAVPAYRLPLAQAVELAIRYTRELPRLGELLGERLTGGILSVDDAVRLAHYVLVVSETRKPDTLRNLDYTLEPGPARLLGVPWRRNGGGRVDALFGLPMGGAESL